VESDNPDFRNLVKATNQGARLEHAKQNWESLPVTVDRAVDRITNSIRPPMVDDQLKSHITRAAAQFKNSIRHSVTEHLVAKTAQVSRSMGTLDQGDFADARAIARRQMLRANRRMTGHRADELISAAQANMADPRTHGSWQLARGRHVVRDTPPSQMPTVATANKFGPLAEEELDEETILDLVSGNMTVEVEAEIHQSATPRKRSKVSPPTHSNRDKMARVGTTSGSEFVVPQVPGRGAGPSKPTSDLPVDPTPTTPTATSSTTPLPSPLPSPTTAPRQPRHLSVFQSSRRGEWTFPEIMDGEDTLLVADSNGVTLSKYTPATWRVAAYRGGRLSDVTRMLASCPLPSQVKQLIFAVGINDREGSETPMINSVTRLRELLCLQTRRVAILTVPHLEYADEQIRRRTGSINQYFCDLLSDSATIVSPDPGFVAVRLTPDDPKHYGPETAQVLVTLLTSLFSSLN